MAAKWLQEAAAKMKQKGTVGKFSAKAKKAGMSTQGYAAKIMKAKNASPTLRKEANFARNAGKASRGR
jgi:hypothetical protein